MSAETPATYEFLAELIEDMGDDTRESIMTRIAAGIDPVLTELAALRTRVAELERAASGVAQ